MVLRAARRGLAAPVRLEPVDLGRALAVLVQEPQVQEPQVRERLAREPLVQELLVQQPQELLPGQQESRVSVQPRLQLLGW